MWQIAEMLIAVIWTASAIWWEGKFRKINRKNRYEKRNISLKSLVILIDLLKLEKYLENSLGNPLFQDKLYKKFLFFVGSNGRHDWFHGVHKVRGIHGSGSFNPRIELDEIHRIHRFDWYKIDKFDVFQSMSSMYSMSENLWIQWI